MVSTTARCALSISTVVRIVSSRRACARLQLLLFLVPSRARDRHGPLEGAERRMAQVTLAPYDGARVPCDRHARLPALHRWRFSSRAALPGTGRTSFHFAPIQAGTCAAFHPVHVQPSKAAPILRWVRAVVRDDPGAACVSTATRAPH